MSTTKAPVAPSDRICEKHLTFNEHSSVAFPEELSSCQGGLTKGVSLYYII